MRAGRVPWRWLAAGCLALAAAARAGEDRWAWARQLLSDPAVVSLDCRRVEWPADRPYVLFDTPDEPALKADGVYYGRKPSWDFQANGGELTANLLTESRVRVVRLPSTLLAPVEAEATARRFLRRWAWFRQAEPVLRQRYSGEVPGGAWQLACDGDDADGLLCRWATATVRLFDGKVVTCQVNSDFTWPRHTLKGAEARAKALAYAAPQVPAARRGTLRVAQVSLDGSEYTVTVEAPGGPGEEALAGDVHVGSDTGELRGTVTLRPVRPETKAVTLYEDSSPVWLPSGLVCASTRQPDQTPACLHGTGSTVLQASPSGALSYLAYDYHAGPARLSGGPRSAELVVTRAVPDAREPTWAVRLLHPITGAARDLDIGPHGFVAVDPLGQFAVTSTHELEGYRLVVAELAEAPRLRWRPLTCQLRPIDVSFSGDGQWVRVFGWAEGHRLGLLRLPRTALASTQAQPVVWQPLPEHGQPHRRLATCADEGWALLLAEDGPWLADGVNPPRQLRWPVLRDAELGGLEVTDWWDACAGPGPDRVTFSGATVDAQQRTRRRIYSVRLDGGDLRAHTPRDEVPVTAARYSTAGVTPYDISARWALAEVLEQRRRPDP